MMIHNKKCALHRFCSRMFDDAPVATLQMPRATNTTPINTTFSISFRPAQKIQDAIDTVPILSILPLPADTEPKHFASNAGCLCRVMQLKIADEFAQIASLNHNMFWRWFFVCFTTIERHNVTWIESVKKKHVNHTTYNMIMNKCEKENILLRLCMYADNTLGYAN